METTLDQISTGVVLEVGKWYKTRIGGKAFVAFNHPLREEGQYIGYIAGSPGIVVWCQNGKCVPHGLAPHDLIEEWAEPTWRPWTDDEIPLGAWYRHKETPGRKFLGIAVGPGEVVHCLGRMKVAELLEDYEYTLDNGGTWLPCGTCTG